MNTQDLIKELEELMVFQVERDLLDFPHNKHAFAPYVVISLLKGIPHKDIPKDVLAQLNTQLEHEEMMSKAIGTRPQLTRIQTWIELFKSALPRR